MSQVQILSPRPLILLDFFSRERHWFQVQNNNWFQFWFHFLRVVQGSHGWMRADTLQALPLYEAELSRPQKLAFLPWANRKARS